MKEHTTSIRTILDQMEMGPRLDFAVMTDIVSRRLPRRDSIRSWRRPTTGMKFKRAERRFHFIAEALISNAEHRVVGRAENISDSGLFIATDAPVFHRDEEITVTIVPFNGKNSYTRKGKIVRQAIHQNHTAGYGLIFI